MNRIFQKNFLPQSRPGGVQIGCKRLEQLQEKRNAHGLKGNVYQEYQEPTMYSTRNIVIIRGVVVNRKIF